MGKGSGISGMRMGDSQVVEEERNTQRGQMLAGQPRNSRLEGASS